jgi:hypothetical protein
MLPIRTLIALFAAAAIADEAPAPARTSSESAEAAATTVVDALDVAATSGR